MVTSSQSSVPTVTTQSFVDRIHEQRKSAFDGVQAMAGICIPCWEEAAARLDIFQVSIRNRGHDLQHEKVVVPPKKDLEVERDGFLREYWALKETSEEIEQMGGFIQTTIEFISPSPTQRVYVHELTLLTTHPALFEEIRKKDPLCRDMVKALGETLAKTATLKERMVTQFTTKLDYSLQRFCQIVDNEGKPISTRTRFIDFCTTPVIPKPIQAQAPGSLELKTGEGSSSSLTDPKAASVTSPGENTPTPKPPEGQQTVASPLSLSQENGMSSPVPSAAGSQVSLNGDGQSADLAVREKTPELPPAGSNGSSSPTARGSAQKDAASLTYSAVAKGSEKGPSSRASSPARAPTPEQHSGGPVETVVVHLSPSPSPKGSVATGASGGEVLQTTPAATVSSQPRVDAGGGAQASTARKRAVISLQPNNPPKVDKKDTK